MRAFPRDTRNVQGLVHLLTVGLLVLDHLSHLYLVLCIVHLFHNLLPNPLVNDSDLDVLDEPIDLRLWFHGHLFSDYGLQKEQDSLFDVDLDESELLVAFVLEDPAEESHFVVFPFELVDGIEDRLKPLDDELSEPILLIQVGVHVLLHGLSRLLVLLARLVKLLL